MGTRLGPHLFVSQQGTPTRGSLAALRMINVCREWLKAAGGWGYWTPSL